MRRSSGAEVRSLRPLVRWAKASTKRRLGRECGENGFKMMWPVVGLSVAVGGALGAFLYYACTVPSSQILGPTLVRGPAEGRRIALTFDDGPLSPFTEQVLDILRERRVPATFFVCGKNVERFPEILRRIHEEGHGLGDHQSLAGHHRRCPQCRANLRQSARLPTHGLISDSLAGDYHNRGSNCPRQFPHRERDLTRQRSGFYWITAAFLAESATWQTARCVSKCYTFHIGFVPNRPNASVELVVRPCF